MFGFLGAPCGCGSAASRSIYRSHFCGLCNRLRVDYGPAARLLVNRDSTFLSLLTSARLPQAASPSWSTACNPLSRVRPLMQEGPGATYAAAVTLCGLQAKLEDQVDDARSGWHALPARGALRLLRRRTARAMSHLRSLGFPVDVVRTALRRQVTLEQDASRAGDVDLDRVSEPSAVALGTIFSHAGDRPSAVWETIGRTTGRLIYALDAIADRKRDACSKAFNPFLIAPRLASGISERLGDLLASLHGALRTAPLQRHRALIHEILGPQLRRKSALILGKADLPPPSSPRSKKPIREETDPTRTGQGRQARKTSCDGCAECACCCPCDGCAELACADACCCLCN